MTPQERFWSKVEKTADCWIWTAGRTGAGYGVVMLASRPQLAHRVSYLWLKGHIPPGLYVCHTCDVPSCVNPDHLFVGTPTENMQDCSRKGRVYSRCRNKTECKRGHAFNEVNTRIGTKGERICILCKRAQGKLDRSKLK